MQVISNMSLKNTLSLGWSLSVQSLQIPSPCFHSPSTLAFKNVIVGLILDSTVTIGIGLSVCGRLSEVYGPSIDR